MPTLKPRVAVSLPPDVRAAVRDLAQASDKAESRLIQDLLTEMAPQLRDLAKLIRAAKSGRKAAAQKALRDLVGGSLAEVMIEQREMFRGK